MIDIQALAETLDNAARNATAVAQLSLKHEISVNQAYEIQQAIVDRKISRGEQLIGMKMGFTSKAKAEQMGVRELIYGWLTDAMLKPENSMIDLNQFVHARVEPELAVRLKRPLSGTPSAEEAWSAVECIAPAMEIIDSRYENFKFSLADVVADNSSSSGLVVGPWQDKCDDPSNLKIVLNFDGTIMHSGSTADVLGNPARSIAKAAEMLSRRNMKLEAGWIVLTGGATAAEALTPSTRVSAKVEKLGDVSFNTGPEIK